MNTQKLVRALIESKPHPTVLMASGSLELQRAIESWRRTVCIVAHTLYGVGSREADAFKRRVFEKAR